jgi:hypothetical protein
MLTHKREHMHQAMERNLDFHYTCLCALEEEEEEE